MSTALEVLELYQLEYDDLKRIQSMPMGGEATSVYYYPDIKGSAYIMSVLQHPGKTASTGESYPGEAGIDTPATVGLIGPLPKP